VVERQPRERRAGVGAADDGSHLLERKQAGQELGEELGGARRELRGLHHHAVAGGERRDQRHDREVERIVPRADDADDADRLVQDGGASRPELAADRHPLRPHPAPQMVARVADRRQHRKDFGKFRLVARAMAEICRDHLSDAPALVPDRAGEPCQVSAALFERGRAGAQERRALRFQDHAHLGVRRRRHGPLDKLLLQRFLHRASSYLIYYYEK
jgi:hypothetical protein